MFSDKTVPPPSENRRSVSSDSDYLLRAVNQFQVEQDILPQLNGSSFRNRYIAIRQGIFTNFPNVLGENVSQSAKAGKLISEYRVEDSMSFTPYYAASEAAMANFEPHIDRWYQQLAQLPPGKEKTAAVYRFLSVIVLGGIQIHPGSEGNGQTFRLLALSYLHDLIPDTNNCFFPIKYQAGGDNLPTSQNAADISIQQLANDFPPLTPTDPQEQTLLDTFRFANKISQTYIQKTVDLPPPKSKAIKTKAMGTLLHLSQQTSQETDLSEIQIDPQELPPAADFIYTAILLKSKIRNSLISLNHHPVWEINLGTSVGQTIDRCSWTVDQTWNTPHGISFIENYIFPDSETVPPANDFQSQLFRNTQVSLETTRKRFPTILEDSTYHFNRHRQALQSPN